MVGLSGASSYKKRFVLPVFHMMEGRDKHSATGTRARVARVRAEYPSQLDYSGDVDWPRVVANKPRGRRLQTPSDGRDLGC